MAWEFGVDKGLLAIARKYKLSGPEKMKMQRMLDEMGERRDKLTTYQLKEDQVCPVCGGSGWDKGTRCDVCNEQPEIEGGGK